MFGKNEQKEAVNFLRENGLDVAVRDFVIACEEELGLKGMFNTTNVTIQGFYEKVPEKLAPFVTASKMQFEEYGYDQFREELISDMGLQVNGLVQNVITATGDETAIEIFKADLKNLRPECKIILKTLAASRGINLVSHYSDHIQNLCNFGLALITEGDNTWF